MNYPDITIHYDLKSRLRRSETKIRIFKICKESLVKQANTFKNPTLYIDTRKNNTFAFNNARILPNIMFVTCHLLPPPRIDWQIRSAMLKEAIFLNNLDTDNTVLCKTSRMFRQFMKPILFDQVKIVIQKNDIRPLFRIIDSDVNSRTISQVSPRSRLLLYHDNS